MSLTHYHPALCSNCRKSRTYVKQKIIFQFQSETPCCQNLEMLLSLHMPLQEGERSQDNARPLKHNLENLLVPHIPRSVDLVWGGLKMDGRFQEFGIDLRHSS